MWRFWQAWQTPHHTIRHVSEKLQVNNTVCTITGTFIGMDQCSSNWLVTGLWLHDNFIRDMAIEIYWVIYAPGLCLCNNFIRDMVIEECILYIDLCCKNWLLPVGQNFLYSRNKLYCTVLYCTALYCTVLYCTVLYCTITYVLFSLYYPVCSLSQPASRGCPPADSLHWGPGSPQPVPSPLSWSHYSSRFVS